MQHSPIEAYDDMADFQLIEIESALGILDECLESYTFKLENDAILDPIELNLHARHRHCRR